MRRLALIAAASLAFIAISEPISANTKRQGMFSTELECRAYGRGCSWGCEKCGDGSYSCAENFLDERRKFCREKRR